MPHRQSAFLPKTGTSEEWSEAYARVDDYLRAFRIRNRIHLSNLNLQILRAAAERHADSPAVSPVRLAIEEAHRQVDAWLSQRLTDPAQPGRPYSTTVGRVAFMLSDGPTRHSDDFLVPDVHDAELEASMRSWSIKAGPDIKLSHMVARDIDLGLVPDAAENIWEFLDRRPFIRVTILLLLFLLATIGVLIPTDAYVTFLNWFSHLFANFQG